MCHSRPIRRVATDLAGWKTAVRQVSTTSPGSAPSVSHNPASASGVPSSSRPLSSQTDAKSRDGTSKALAASTPFVSLRPAARPISHSLSATAAGSPARALRRTSRSRTSTGIRIPRRATRMPGARWRASAPADASSQHRVHRGAPKAAAAAPSPLASAAKERPQPGGGQTPAPARSSPRATPRGSAPSRAPVALAPPLCFARGFGMPRVSGKNSISAQSQPSPFSALLPSSTTAFTCGAAFSSRPSHSPASAHPGASHFCRCLCGG